MVISNLLMCVVSVLLGLVMLFAPQGFVSALVVCIGIAAIVNGFLNLVSLRNIIDDRGFKRAIIIRGIINIVVGLAAIIMPIILAGTVWTIIIYILAAELIVSALIEVYGIWKLRKAGIEVGPYIIEAAVSVLLAAVLFAMPATIGLTIVRILGAIIILAGISGLIWNLRMRKIDGDSL